MIAINDTTSSAAMQNSTPVFAQLDSVGVLLLHGYSGSPAELQPLGQTLAEAGYNIHAPLLAGHGSTPDALFGVRWEDWQRSAEDGLQYLRTMCQRVFICGFSAGGLLALRLAAREPVAGIITLAPALRLRGGSLLRLAGLLQYVIPISDVYSLYDETTEGCATSGAGRTGTALPRCHRRGRTQSVAHALASGSRQDRRRGCRTDWLSRHPCPQRAASLQSPRP